MSERSRVLVVQKQMQPDAFGRNCTCTIEFLLSGALQRHSCVMVLFIIHFWS